MAEPKYIDIHVHFGAPGDPEHGDLFYWSKEFTQTFAYRAFKWLTRTFLTKLNKKKVEKHLVRLVKKSHKVKQCVLLAMDMVYDENGDPHLKDQTHLYVSNKGLADIVQRNKELFRLGASVHPYRRPDDWKAELENCLKWGAVLCKWIPSAQKINPGDWRCDGFYEWLAAHNLPLLCHVGPEATIPPYDDWARQKLNNPKLLRRALNKGVTVIAAHCGLPLLPPPIGSETDLDELLALFDEAKRKERKGEESWKLYADLSALFLGTRESYIENVKRIGFDNLIFGSDYPILIMDVCRKGGTRFLLNWNKRFNVGISSKDALHRNVAILKEHYKERIGILTGIWRLLVASFSRNALDRNVKMLESHGFPEVVFTKAETLFSLIK